MSLDNSMPYTMNQSGFSSGLADYLDKLQLFLVSIAGFTLISSKVDYPNIGEHYRVFQNGDLFYHFQSNLLTYSEDVDSLIYLHVNKDYNDTVDFFNQTNTPSNRNYFDSQQSLVIPILKNIGIPQYYFFWNTRNLYLINEYKIGLYSHASMGRAIHFGTSDHYYVTSTTGGNITSEYGIQGSYSILYGVEKTKYSATIDNVYISYNDIELNGTDQSNFPSFTNELKESSFISTELKGLLWSPSSYIKSGAVSSHLKTPLIKHSDNFLCWNDWYNDLEEYYLGTKKFKYFPFYQRVVPASHSDYGNGCGIILRTE